VAAGLVRLGDEETLGAGRVKGTPRKGGDEERGRPDEAGIQLPKRESTAIRPLTLDGAQIKAWRVDPEGIWVPPANALAGCPPWHGRLVAVCPPCPAWLTHGFENPERP
jgi:hypothetical protein